METIKIHYCLLRCKAELDQLKSGLSILGVGGALSLHASLLAPIFVTEKTAPLTAGTCYS